MSLLHASIMPFLNSVKMLLFTAEVFHKDDSIELSNEYFCLVKEYPNPESHFNFLPITLLKFWQNAQTSKLRFRFCH